MSGTHHHSQDKRRCLPAYGGNAEAILARIESLLPKDADGEFLAFKPGATGAEEKSDVVHDFLACLAEQMIEMNKEKKAQTRRFLQWLETEMGHPVNELRLKTKLREFHEGDFDALLGAIKANDKLLGRMAHRSGFQEDLRREFDASMAALGPLKQRIAATDWLIDQIVYRLYGLTPDEVAVVEDRAGRESSDEASQPTSEDAPDGG